MKRRTSQAASVGIGAPQRQATSLEIVHHDLCPKRLGLLDKLQMLRMILIFVLRLLRLKLEVQSNLVTLIYDGAMAPYHLASMEIDDPGN